MTTSLIKPVRWGKIEQGLIFNCAFAEDYSACNVFGLVITARCDLVHDKTPNFNYLPVVKLKDWLDRDLRIIACQRSRKDLDGAVRSELKSSGYSPTVLATEPLRAVIDNLFPPELTDKKKIKAKEKLLDLAERIARVDKVEQEKSATGSWHLQDKTLAQAGKSLLQECIHQKLSGYYFLNSIEKDGEDSGYVVLLREVRHIPRELASRVVSGIDHAEYIEYCKSKPEAINKLNIGTAEFALPLGVVKSPEIEHLLQAFALLFSRIGISDPDPQYIERLQDVHLPHQEPK